MAKRSRQKGRGRPRPQRRRRSSLGFGIVMGLLVLLGVGGIIASRGGDGGDLAGPAPGEHWHAPLGINICGQWKPNFETSMAASGIHSHGDGQMHLEPRSRAEAYTNATVGLLLASAGGELTPRSIRLSDGTDLGDGDKCPNLDNQSAGLRWSVNGTEKPKGSDPSRYVPNDGEVIALAFLPEKAEIGVPPVKGPDNAGESTPTTG
jgi:hypothetical protein